MSQEFPRDEYEKKIKGLETRSHFSHGNKRIE